MCTPRPVLIAFSILILVGAAADGAEHVTIDGVEHVRNGAVSRDGIQHLNLREVWRAGSEDDDLFFGLVPRVLTGTDDRVYVLDSQMCRVLVYGRDGELLDTLFRQGEGPGEINRPRDMVLMGDGRVGLIQEFPGTVSFMQRDGTPADKVQFVGPSGGTTNLTACAAAGDVLILSGNHDQEGPHPGVRKRWNALERYDAAGRFEARYADNHAIYDFNDFEFREREHLPSFWFAFTVAADGRVYSPVDRDRYAVRVSRPDGSPLRIIERDYAELPRTDRDRQSLENIILSAFNGAPFTPRLVIEKTEPAIAVLRRGLQLHVDGSLWVLSGRGARPSEPGVMGVFDVFAPDGEFVRQVAVHASHDMHKSGLFLSGADRFLVVKGYMDSLAAQFGNGVVKLDENEDPEPPEVICYEIVR